MDKRLISRVLTGYAAFFAVLGLLLWFLRLHPVFWVTAFVVGGLNLLVAALFFRK